MFPPLGWKGVWSLFVTKTKRMTFRIDQAEIEITDPDYEDFHQRQPCTRAQASA